MERRHNGIVRVFSAFGKYFLFHVVSGEIVPLPGRCELKVNDDGLGSIRFNGAEDMRAVWINKCNGGFLNESVHDTVGDSSRAYIRDHAQQTSVWMENLKSEFVCRGWSHKSAHCATAQCDLAAWHFRLPEAGSRIAWELPFVQAAVQGDCSRSRWVANNSEHWLQNLSDLGFGVGHLRPGRRSVQEKARLAGQAVDDEALLKGSLAEATVSTSALLVISSRCAQKHHQRSDEEVQAAEDFLWAFTDSFFGKGSTYIPLNVSEQSVVVRNDYDRAICLYR